MKITDIKQAARDPNRANIFVDGKFRFSLDIFQIGELGIKIGNDYTDSELTEFETESQFGKLYARALEYTMLRPHSSKEVREYLKKKTYETKYKSRKTGEIKTREGISEALVDRVYNRLAQKGYLNDERFAAYWVEHRNQKKGASMRKLVNELRLKGVEQSIIDQALSDSDRDDNEEIKKIIEKKAAKYNDRQKLMQYLARQGFSYDTISTALEETSLD